jgi:hypothetical protein
MPAALEASVSSQPSLVTLTVPPMVVPEPSPPKATRPPELEPLPPPPPIDWASIAFALAPCVTMWPVLVIVTVPPLPPRPPPAPSATAPETLPALPPPPPIDWARMPSADAPCVVMKLLALTVA